MAPQTVVHSLRLYILYQSFSSLHFTSFSMSNTYIHILYLLHKYIYIHIYILNPLLLPSLIKIFTLFLFFSSTVRSIYFSHLLHFPVLLSYFFISFFYIFPSFSFIFFSFYRKFITSIFTLSQCTQ